MPGQQATVPCQQSHLGLLGRCSAPEVSHCRDCSSDLVCMRPSSQHRPSAAEQQARMPTKQSQAALLSQATITLRHHVTYPTSRNTYDPHKRST